MNAQPKSENQKYRYLRKTCGADDVRTKRQKEIYIYEKERRQEVGMALQISVNVGCMNKSGFYAHMKMLIEKGKEKSDSKMKLTDDDETIDNAPNNTAYKWWSCHIRYKLLCRKLPPQKWGTIYRFFWQAGHADPMDA